MAKKLIQQRVDKCPLCSHIGFKPFCTECNNTGKVKIEVYAEPYELEIAKTEEIIKPEKVKRTKKTKVR